MAGMLSTGILDQLRARQEASFDETLTIQRNTRTVDAQGGELWTWATLTTGVPCGVGRGSWLNRENPIAGVVTPVAITPFRLPHDVDILATDRLVWPESGGSTYYLISDPDYSYKTAVYVTAAKVG